MTFSWERPEADCEKLKPSSMGRKLAAQAAATKELLTASREEYQKKIEEQVGIVFASPPCETFSSASNISRDNFHRDRDHNDPTKPPRKLEGCTNPAATAKRTKALQHDYMVNNMFQSFFKDKGEGYSYKTIIENPVGSLRKRPYMLGERMQKEFTRTTVDYCAFGKPYRKSTDIWTTFVWMPNGSTGSGRCDIGDCVLGNTKGKFKHRMVIHWGRK